MSKARLAAGRLKPITTVASIEWQGRTMERSPPVQPKKVYLNDILIGEASSWAEVRELLKAMRVGFAGSPGMAEGPSGFFVSSSVATANLAASDKASGAA